MKRDLLRSLLLLTLGLSLAPKALAANVSGTITNMSGAPIDGIDLDIYDAAGTNITTLNATSDAAGDYTFTNVPNGTYKIKADPPTSSSFLVDEFWSGNVDTNAYDFSSGLLITVNGSVNNIDFKLEEGGSISGTITAAGGGALTGVDLDLYDSAGVKLIFSATTDATGAYQFKAFPTGASSIFYVRADPATTTRYVDQFYNNKPDLATATPVTVNRNQNKPNINFALVLGGRITGTITEQGVGPVAGMDLDLFDATTNTLIPAYNAKSDAAGAYTLGAVPPGTYKLRADPDPATFLIRQYWNNQPDLLNATVITVTANADQAAKNFTLQRGGVVSGTITEQGAGPVANLDLDVFDTTTGAFLPAYDAKTDAAGAYTLGPMPAGSYRISADPDPATYLIGQFVEPVAVSQNATQTVNFTLVRGGIIAGRITDTGAAPIAGIDLDLFDPATGTFIGAYNAQSDASGNYQFGPLPAGAYHVKADDVPPQPYVDQFWSGADFPATATPVNVTVGATAQNINFSLETGVMLQGRVTDAQTASAVVGLDLDLYSQAGVNLPYDDTLTDASGNYTMGPIPPGTYVLQADPDPLTGYFPQYYASAMTLDTATPISLAAADVTANLALGKSRSLAGAVRDRSTNTPLSGVTLRLYDQAGTQLTFLPPQITDGTGAYSFGPVLPGNYFVEGVPALGDSHFPKFYLNSDTFGGATPISLATSDVNNANFTLPLPARIGGTLLKTGSLDPLAGLTVRAYASGQPDAVATTQSDGAGAFQLDGLRSGSYTVSVQIASGLVYWAGAGTPGGVTDPGQALAVAATEDELTSGLDMVLTTSTPGLAQGTVLQAGSLQPQEGMTIEAFAPGDLNNPVSTNVTNAQGAYTLQGLWTGSYLIAMETTGGRRYWAGAGTPLGVYDSTQALSVSTTDGQATSGIDFQLIVTPGQVQGAVLQSGNLQPLPDIVVEAFTAGSLSQPVATATTGADGAYTLTGLNTGDYRIAIEAPAGRRYWAGLANPLGVADAADAQSVTATNNQTTSGINFQAEVIVPPTVPTVNLLALATALLAAARRRFRK